jgi:23S rRNA (pseudouridine1915-N3)-methyltransferase
VRVTIAAIGRARTSPEAALISDYLARASRAGRPLGLGPFDVVELEAKKSGQSAEAELLEKTITGAGWVCALDERGKTLTSPEFAEILAQARDRGTGPSAFIIGGADGLTPNLRDRADVSISFGRMVWPHMLARVMLSEQLYRATQILSGTPYHRA